MYQKVKNVFMTKKSKDLILIYNSDFEEKTDVNI